MSIVTVSWRIVNRKNWQSCSSDWTKNCRHCTYHWLVSWMLMLSIRQRNVNERRKLLSLRKPSVANTYNSFMRWSWNNSISSRKGNTRNTKRKSERFSDKLLSSPLITTVSLITPRHCKILVTCFNVLFALLDFYVRTLAIKMANLPVIHSHTVVMTIFQEKLN